MDGEERAHGNFLSTLQVMNSGIIINNYKIEQMNKKINAYLVNITILY